MIKIARMSEADVREAHLIAASSLDTFWTEESIRKEIRENKVARYMVAKSADEVLGFCGAHIILDEAHIINMAVKESARKQGIGSRLMEAVLQYASNLGASYITLEVRQSNRAAVALYQKFGFIKAGIRKGYYHGEDGILMVLDHLPPAEESFSEEETVFEE